MKPASIIMAEPPASHNDDLSKPIPINSKKKTKSEVLRGPEYTSGHPISCNKEFAPSSVASFHHLIFLRGAVKLARSTPSPRNTSQQQQQQQQQLPRMRELSRPEASPPSQVSAHDVVDFVPETQKIAGILSALIGIALFVVGSVFLAFPTWMVPFVFPHANTPSDTFSFSSSSSPTLTMLDLTLSRLTGGILLGQGLSSLFLLVNLYYDVATATTTSTSPCLIRPVSVDKSRTAVSIQALTGLLFVVVGLLDNRITDDTAAESVHSLYLLAMGFGVLIVACLGLMFSYWPVLLMEEEQEENGTPTQPRQRHTSQHNNDPSRQEQNEATEPLLGRSEDGSDNEILSQEAAAAYRLLEEPTVVASATNDDEEEVPVSGGDDNEDGNGRGGTSRMRGTRRLLKLAAPQVLYLYVGCAVLLVRLPFSLSIPHFVSTTLGAVGRGDFVGARTEILLLFLLGTIDAFLDFWCIFLFGYANQRIVRGVRIDTFLSILKQEVGFFDKHTSGELASRLNSDCGEMAGDLTWFFRFSIESVVRITGITAYMVIRSPTLGACALSIVPLVAVVNRSFGIWLNKNAREVQDALAKANSVAQETFSCIRTVMAFASERFEYKKYVEKIDCQYQLNIRQLYMTGLYYMFVSTFLINTVVQSALLLIGTNLIQRNRLTPEILLAFMLYQGQLQNEMMNLFTSYSSLIKSSGAGDKVFALLDQTPPPPGTGNPTVRSTDGDEALGNLQNAALGEQAVSSMSIKLENVHFRYPSRPDHPVLQGLDIEIRKGQTVALVGPSGCGKSTIVALLKRFYDPTHGRVFIDDVDVKTLDVKAHRRKIGVVSQDPTLFGGTILSNITYGCTGATKEQAIEAARLANAHEFILSFPNGYETEVGERGVQLSGGQKQRIAISRAVIRNPALLLLDEATSALDSESEQIVQKALDSLLRANSNITTVIIAHRLQTVRNADRIAVILEGRVVEFGSHDTLLGLERGYYKNMIAKSRGDGLLVDT